MYSSCSPSSKSWDKKEVFFQKFKATCPCEDSGKSWRLNAALILFSKQLNLSWKPWIRELINSWIVVWEVIKSRERYIKWNTLPQVQWCCEDDCFEFQQPLLYPCSLHDSRIPKLLLIETDFPSFGLCNSSVAAKLLDPECMSFQRRLDPSPNLYCEKSEKRHNRAHTSKWEDNSDAWPIVPSSMSWNCGIWSFLHSNVMPYNVRRQARDFAIDNYDWILTISGLSCFGVPMESNLGFDTPLSKFSGAFQLWIPTSKIFNILAQVSVAKYMEMRSGFLRVLMCGGLCVVEDAMAPTTKSWCRCNKLWKKNTLRQAATSFARGRSSASYNTLISYKSTGKRRLIFTLLRMSGSRVIAYCNCWFKEEEDELTCSINWRTIFPSKMLLETGPRNLKSSRRHCFS